MLKHLKSKPSFHSYIDQEENPKKLETLPSSKDFVNSPTKSSRDINQQVLQALQNLRKGSNLEKFLEAHGLSGSIALKKALDNFLAKENEENKKQEILKWQNQIEELKDLLDGKTLKKWLESKGVVEKEKIKEIRKELASYFEKHEKVLKPRIQEPHWGQKVTTKNKAKDLSRSSSESNATIEKVINETSEKSAHVRHRRDFGPCQKLEEFPGRSLIYQENTLANKIWEEFKEMSVPKKVAIVVGITVVVSALGFVSWRLVLLAFPSVFQANHYWGEVLAQWFIQRQESTFHLLQHTAQNAKPLSTAWANQYLLWKYI